ncbi:uncharacterized protein I303_106046 [Kwoniella dejecticola CBS 10117]|uniref:Mitochondrial K+-H+ exchange-related-domain-containing protein n=1 Tax=Kwoniella dejecticola CBS 10117 TaxID=1296121 RepID=A0A1A6A147_9TREE|nr:uncharacterized protein I303_06066 [Kwoniella dejecticola CBS 10117]OBR83784.1 hypothetical protein I303_06066 [Kwoniella dejecticola CBS 10117]
MTSKIPQQLSKRPFRIFALPLARIPKPHSLPLSPPPNPAYTPTGEPSAPTSANNAGKSTGEVQGASESQSESAKTPLMLFQTTQPDPPPEKGPPNIASRALNKASDTWLNLGKKPKDSWTYWFYAKGEKLMDRIEYEEWSLKAIKEGEGVKIGKDGKILGERIEIPLLRPEIKGTTLPPLLPKLHRFLLHRIPYHRKMMYRSLFATPLTAPFAIIPIIPNFPFFYVLWRAWSHYKSWRGALYLENLLQNGLIVEKESKELSEIYATKPSSIESGKDENKAPDETSSKGAHLKDLSKEHVEAGTHEGGVEKLPAQSKGEAEGAIDGTSTPESLIHKPSTSSTAAPGTTVPKTDDSTKGTEKKSIQQPFPAPAPGPITSKASHRSLLLSPSQIPLLAKTFSLKPLEIMDITRAVEQADYRARKADKAKADKANEAVAAAAQEAKKDGEGKKEKSTEWRGNLHR